VKSSSYIDSFSHHLDVLVLSAKQRRPTPVALTEGGHTQINREKLIICIALCTSWTLLEMYIKCIFLRRKPFLLRGKSHCPICTERGIDQAYGCLAPILQYTTLLITFDGFALGRGAKFPLLMRRRGVVEAVLALLHRALLNGRIHKWSFFHQGNVLTS